MHIRLEVDDITKLAGVAPFAWSTYRLGEAPAEGRRVGGEGRRRRSRSNGSEMVRVPVLHLPSKIRYHNTKRDVGHGDILVWEQSLSDRLRGVPLELDARMVRPSESSTRRLALFGIAFVVVAVVFSGSSGG